MHAVDFDWQPGKGQNAEKLDSSVLSYGSTLEYASNHISA